METMSVIDFLAIPVMFVAVVQLVCISLSLSKIAFHLAVIANKK